MTIEQLYDAYLAHPIVTTDSRRTPQDSLFFALKGELFDGNQYAASALEQGCALAVVDDPAVVRDERYLLVEDVLTALQQLAALHRSRLGTPVIGITGTNGKTTTKELMAAVLSSTYHILYTEGNLNNHIGVPLTLLRLQPEHQIAIVEMGANKPGDIAELTAIARPDYGLITNIGRAHLQGFGSLEGVRRTKGELYDHVRAAGGALFLHTDDDTLVAMAEGMDYVSYGTSPAATVQGRLSPQQDSPYLSFDLMDGVSDTRVMTRLVGDYNLPNALAAVAAGRFFDVPDEAIVGALASYKPGNNRSQWMETERGNSLIVDAYNANPVSMRAALDNFDTIRTDKTPVLILGDMNELGAESAAEHAALLRRIREGRSSRVLLCGPCLMAMEQDFPEGAMGFADHVALAHYLEEHPIHDSLILLKGSHGIHLENIIPLC